MVLNRYLIGMEFKPSEHGFPFPNCWPVGLPVLEIPTPFGAIPIGDASNGVCGGMIFAVADHFHFQRPVPREQNKAMLRYFFRRLMASWHLPFGMLKYYEWQRRPTASKYLAGVKVIDGLSFLTATVEWPKIKAGLDAGTLVPLGLQKTEGWSVYGLSHNHQVLAYKYEQQGDDITIYLYDPNYACDDSVKLTFSIANPDGANLITHSIEGANIRGLFHNDYSPIEPKIDHEQG